MGRGGGKEQERSKVAVEEGRESGGGKGGEKEYGRMDEM